MQVEFLESGQVLQKIIRLLKSKSIDEIDLAVAYLTSSGYSCIEEPLKKFLRNGGRVKFLVGLTPTYVTESRALRTLLRLTKERTNYRKLLQLRYHNPSKGEFHPKLILGWSKGKLRDIVLGSSNLTGGGQRKNVEANAAITVKGSKDVRSSKFELDVEEFFKYIWGSGEKLDPSAINKYRKGEKKRKQGIARFKKGLPKTKLPDFLYIEGKRRSSKSLEILCTDCRRNYIRIPFNAFYCDDYPFGGPSVEMPSLLDSKEQRLRKTRKARVKVNGKKLQVSTVGLRCPDCNVEVDFTDDFTLWIICKDCAEKRKHNHETVCRPFAKWNNKTAKNLFYSLDPKRITVK